MADPTGQVLHAEAEVPVDAAAGTGEKEERELEPVGV